MNGILVMNTSVKHAFDDEVGRDWLKGLLKDLVVTVTFTKKDGTERVMQATLKEDLLPEVQADFGSDTPTRSKSKDTISVWDVESQGWRSFRWDSIKSIDFTLGE